MAPATTLTPRRNAYWQRALGYRSGIGSGLSIHERFCCRVSKRTRFHADSFARRIENLDVVDWARHHSSRLFNAIIGSIRDAHRAGMYVARVAVRERENVASRIVC